MSEQQPHPGSAPRPSTPAPGGATAPGRDGDATAPDRDEQVDEAIEESFPASDPPSSTPSKPGGGTVR